MKRIGYVYKYSEEEQKGILVYGQWRTGLGYNDYIKNKPIKFIVDDCKTAVKTGQLVYFELTETGATNIEHASLANFDTGAIRDLTTWKDGDHYGWYDLNTKISYERLNDIFIPATDLSIEPTTLQTSSDVADLLDSDGITEEDELYDLCDDEDDFMPDLYDFVDFEDSIWATNPVDIPNSIDGIFDCFGKYEHYLYEFKNITATIDILDIALWFDDDILNGKFYGSTVKQMSNLCDIFIFRKRIDENGEVFIPKRKDNCVPDSWRRIISKINNKKLRVILSKYPILQHVLPDKFCMRNLDALSEEYGMPDVKICKAYNKHQINKVSSVSDYELLHGKFYTYAHCIGKHIEGEGVPMCHMGKRYIKTLTTLLDRRFKDVVTINIKTKFEDISGISFASLCINQDQEKSVLLSIGHFLDLYDDIINRYYSLDKLYKDMPAVCQNILYEPTYRHINNSILEYSKDNKTLPSDLESFLYELKAWIDISTIKNITQIVNPRFETIDDLSELKTAYDLKFITWKQYYKSFCSSTNEYSIERLLDEIDKKNENTRIPIFIQWYIISRVLVLFKSKSYIPHSYIRTAECNIHNVRDCIKWINSQYEQNAIDKLIVKKAENRLVSVLTEEEKWTLFEEKLISTPGIENIRAKLSDAYKKNSFDEKYFKKECFQDVMYQDILSSDSIKHRCLIAEQLDEKHLNLLQNKSDDELKLIAWITIPCENCDWSLIFANFTYLPDEQQIKIFRYLFSLIAQKKIMFSIDDLYDIFVETKRACPAICGVIYLLKEKISDSNAVISSEFVERIIGCEDENKQSFLLAKTFFYACNGHLAIEYYKIPADYYTTNGRIDKININGTDFYTITFNDMGMEDDDGCFEDEDIIQAKSILELNIKTKVINGKYIIETSEEMALKQFIMEYNIEDYCGIIDSEYEIINKKLRSDFDSYEHYLTPYDEDKYHVCRNINCCDIDPENGMPFYWCNKKPCARRCHYIQPTSQWEQYKFSDFLYILLGSQTSTISQVWDITSEVSQFMHDFITVMYTTSCDNLSESSIIYSHQGNKSNEIGRWTEDMSIIHGEDDVNYDESEDDSLGQDAPTYNRYRGSYAQDVMGYSDDDIDDIFEGDPDAYWNID